MDVDPVQLLQRTGTIAVVGCSRDPWKSAGNIPKELQERGWRIIPVNPNVDEVLGEKSYPLLRDVPEPIDLVNVFRPSDEAPAIVRQAVEVGAKAVWLQLGIASEEARALAEDAGLLYVEDDCTGAIAYRFDLHPLGR